MADEFLIKVRTKLAGLLIQAGQYPEARTEIEQVLKTSAAMQWHVTGNVKSWMSASWYGDAKSLGDNSQLYAGHAGEAEEILFADIPAELAVVEYVNRDRKILNFVVAEGRHGHLRYDRFLRKVAIGDCIVVRLSEPSAEGFFKALTLRKTERQPAASVLKPFSGALSIHSGNSFGIAGDVFVAPELITACRLANGDHISGRAVRSFNKRRQVWGWKAVDASRDERR